MKKYRVAVIGRTGKGNYGQSLDNVWLKYDCAEMVAVADEDEQGRGAVSNRDEQKQEVAADEDEQRGAVATQCPETHFAWPTVGANRIQRPRIPWYSKGYS